MRIHRFPVRLFWLFVLAALAFSSTTPRALAVQPSVAAGYDLETTKDGTKLNGNGYIGVPLGTFNFGGAIGVQSVGDADTIIQRLGSSPAPSVPGTAAAVNAQIDALQMETPFPINEGFGLDNYFITLQSIRGGPLSTGQMTIHFDTNSSGTFTSSLDLFYDVRKGALGGPIVQSFDDLITSAATPWQNAPPDANDVLISGANSNLNGFNTTTQDFWPTANISLTGAIAFPTFGNAVAVPEPLSTALLVLPFTILARRRRLA